MEDSLYPNELHQQSSQKKGGFRTMPFIIANEALEKVATYGIPANMIFYLKGGYHMSVATANVVLSLSGTATNFLPVVGAFLSDSYLGRYMTILLGCLVSFLGMVLLWLTAVIPEAKPPYCDLSSKSCKSATPAQLTVLYASLGLMSIGAGGIRPCSVAFGADQLNKEGNPNIKRVMQSFFNWYYVSTTVSIMVALTVIVYIQDHFGWKIGFGIPAVVMFISGLFFVMATPFYVKLKPNKSLFAGFAQVSIAAFRNRHIVLPPKTRDCCYHHANDSKMVVPSDRLRFLDKACIIRDHNKELDSTGIALAPLKLCTVEQVEELKALLKVIPLWSTGIIMAITMSQNSFPALLTGSMDRHITTNFQLPAGSFGIFTVLTLTIWIAIYDRLIVPKLAKITGKPQGLDHRQRMGIGLILAIMAMATSTIVESVRRRTAIKQGFANNPKGVLDMSAMWLIPQYCLTGLAEAFNAIGQIEFYYSQFPESMSSIASALFSLSFAFGNLFAGIIVRIVDEATKTGGKESWVSNNINNAHYDYYYGLLTIMSGFNFIYFLICCSAYGPSDRERAMIHDHDEDEDLKEQES